MFFIVILHLRMNDIRSYPRLKNDHLWHWMKNYFFHSASSSSFLNSKQTHTKSQSKQINEKILSHLTMIIKSLAYIPYNHHVLLLFFVFQWNSIRCIPWRIAAKLRWITTLSPVSSSFSFNGNWIYSHRCYQMLLYFVIHLRCDLRSEPTFFPI